MGYVQHSGDDDAEKLGQRFREIGDRAARRFGFEDAGDVAQRIFLELWQKRDAASEHANPAAFVASIAKFRKRDVLEENSRRLREEVSLTRWDERTSTENIGEDASHLSALPEPLIVPDRSVELAEARRCLAKVEAITSGFSQKWRYIFEQCILQERSEKEVAKETGLTYGTVRNYVRQIRRKLREGCQQEA